MRPDRRLFLVALVVAGLGGCRQDPQRLLGELARAYRAADRYADDAVVTVRIGRDGQVTEQRMPFRVAFERPDRLRVEAYDARVVSDGETLLAAVGNVPGQVLAARVTSPLDLEQLFADEELQAALAGGEAGCPTQLAMLLADDTIDLILADADWPPRVAADTVHGRPCDRVDLDKPDGRLSLWIDRESRLLRRMEVPAGAYATFLSRQSRVPTTVAVVVDFADASFDPELPADAFAFAVPAGANTVDRLQPLEAPAPPIPRLGERAERFTLRAADGTTIDRDALAGRPAVLEFFHADCAACGRTMPAVARGIEAAGGSVRHLAVAVDDDDVADDALRAELTKHGGRGEFVRDPRGLVAAALGVNVFPAVVILAADGTVADAQTGARGRLAADVTEVLAALAAGRPTAELVRKRYEERLATYRRELDRAAGTGAIERLPEQVIAPPLQPVRFKLRRAWRATGVALPGNVLCLDESHGADGAARVVALDGWRTAVELDAGGRELARHELPLPRDAAVGFLRTALDATGARWWLAAAKGGAHVFLFDADWRLRTTYPAPGDSAHDPVVAAHLVDVDGDAAPEIVCGFAGDGGVEAATLEGRRIWRQAAPAGLLDLAPGAPAASGPRGLLGIDGGGRLVALSGDAPPRALPGTGAWRLVEIATGPVAPDATWTWLALAESAPGRRTALGPDPDADEPWSLPLADGVHRDGPIEPVAWADLLGTPRRQWLVAGPDGSVTVAWADGRVVDRYQHGRPLVGIGGFRQGDEAFVVLATPDAVEALRLDDVALD